MVFSTEAEAGHNFSAEYNLCSNKMAIGLFRIILVTNIQDKRCAELPAG
jgi:hypothetical protein